MAASTFRSKARVWAQEIQRHLGIERAIGLLVLALFILLRAWDPLPLQTLRLKTFDYFQVVKPRAISVEPAIIVDIDERSLKAYGQWPWPRTLLADLVSRIGASGAAAIGLDIIFPEPDRMSPRLIAESLPNLSETASDALRALPDNDRVFAAAIQRARVVLGLSGLTLPTDKSTQNAIKTTPFVTLGVDPKPYIFRLPSIVGSVPELDAAAAGRGLVTIIPEIDGIVRRVPALMLVGGEMFPALSIELLRVALGAPSITVRANERGVQNIILGKALIPTDENGLIWINFTKHDPNRFVSAADVLAGRLPPDRLRGKLVIIGTSATGLFDQKPTPVDAAVPGVEVHAQLLESILTGTFLKRPPYATGAEIALAIILSLTLILTIPKFGARLAFLGGLAMALIVIAISWYFYDAKLLLIDAWFPLLTGLVIFFLLVFVNYMREEQERTIIRGAFERYISNDLIDQLVEDPDRIVLGGQTKELTLLFSDIRKFTTISEGYRQDPQGLTKLMNRFLTPLTEAILEQRGTIDKYMGDAIMAFWNAPVDVPDHPRRACEAALTMRERLAVLNEALLSEAQAAGRPHVPLRVGVGINTGQCVVGNMGSNLRFDYSALGDTVNLASRIEGLTKQYSVTILVGERTASAAADMALIEVDLVRVMGKKIPERIYALFGGEDLARSQGFQAFVDLHQRGLAEYRDRNWDAALATFGSAEGQAPSEVPIKELYALYRTRIDGYLTNPPAPDWDGSAQATEK